MSILRVEHLTKRYKGFAAIDDVNFTVNKGEVVGFVGLNGAGKSTTINSLLGFLRPTDGTVSIFGDEVLPENAHRSHQKIGFASGDMSLFVNLTGKQYLRFVAGRYHETSSERRDELSARFDPELDKKIGELSRGNKQKIALIAAFLSSPELVILDEPSSGLDPLMQQVFVELIKEEAAKGTTIFMSSHYLNEVIDVCSRVLLIREGKLIKDMPTSSLLTSGGKLVRVVTKIKVAPPMHALDVATKRNDDGYELTFIFKAQSARLQQWLSGIPHLIDVTISDHTIEDAFDDLYALETSEK